MSHEATHDTVREALSGSDDPSIARLLGGTDGWSISEAAAQSVFRLVLALQPYSVLEFGAGWSSVVIGLALERLGGRRRLTSLDTTADYSREPWRRLEELRDVDAVLAISSLGLSIGREGLSFGYRGLGRTGRSRGPFDFVFIDAPPSRYGRYGTLFAARRFLHPGTIVVLDDTSRPQEAAVVERWMRCLPGLECLVNDTKLGRGLAVFRVGAEVRQQFHGPSFLWSIKNIFAGQQERREWRMARR